MSKILTKADILAAPDLPHEDVAVPEWGDDCVVRIRSMTAAERDEWEAAIVSAKGAVNLPNIRARLVALCAVGGDGARLFETAEDIAALGRKAAKPMQRLFDAASRLNALREQDVEELRKN